MDQLLLGCLVGGLATLLSLDVSNFFLFCHHALNLAFQLVFESTDAGISVLLVELLLIKDPSDRCLVLLMGLNQISTQRYHVIFTSRGRLWYRRVGLGSCYSAIVSDA